MNEKLIALLEDKIFLAKIAALDTVDEVLAAIKVEGVEVSREEFDAVMDEIAKYNAQQGELSETELDNVAGGFWTAAAIIAGVTALVGAAKWYIYDEPYQRGKDDAKKDNNKRKNQIC